jgi:hypothetical protein
LPLDFDVKHTAADVGLNIGEVVVLTTRFSNPFSNHGELLGMTEVAFEVRLLDSAVKPPVWLPGGRGLHPTEHDFNIVLGNPQLLRHIANTDATVTLNAGGA